MAKWSNRQMAKAEGEEEAAPPRGANLGKVDERPKPVKCRACQVNWTHAGVCWRCTPVAERKVWRGGGISGAGVPREAAQG